MLAQSSNENKVSYLPGHSQQVHCPVKLVVLDKEVGTPGHQLRICALIQILGDHLQSGKLLGVER